VFMIVRHWSTSASGPLGNPLSLLFIKAGHGSGTTSINGVFQSHMGLSGGIDSACNLFWQQKPGEKHVKAVLLPSKFSSGHSIKDAQDWKNLEWNMRPFQSKNLSGHRTQP